jgi:hypothetical protein
MPAEDSPGAGAGRFIQLNIDFLRETSLSGEARWLGCVLATFANFERLAWPGLRTLRKLTGLGINRLKSARAELVARGYIKRVQPRAKRARFGTVQYEITTRILHPPKNAPNKNAGSDRENHSSASGQQAHEHRA